MGKAWIAVGLVVMLATPIQVRRASGGCNAIPSPPPAAFRGVRGSINRAYVQSGDEVRITLGSADFIPSVTDVNDLRTVVAIPSAGAQQGLSPLSAPLAQVSVSDVRLQQAYPAPPVVAFNFPAVDLAGPVIIRIGSAQDGFDPNAPVTPCSDKPAAGLLACIDTIAPPPGVEMTSCSGRLEMIKLPKANDFRDLCTRQDGTPTCAGSAVDLQFAIDAAGDAFIPMHWGQILHPGSAPRRRVRGSTSMRAFLDEPYRIIVPNADYLSTASPIGFGFSPKPVFEPDRPSPTNAYVLALTGQTDKDDSVLRVCRRVPLQFECGPGPHDGEACDPASGASNCPAACVGIYATCAGSGLRVGRPCTRKADCGAGGTCQAGSTCQRQGVDQKTACRRDVDCLTGEECGPGLFDFRYDGRARGNVVTIPRYADLKVDPELMGVCDDPPYEGNLCPNDSWCRDSSHNTPRCIAFRAAAGKFE